MIVWADAGAYRVVNQTDHARLAGEILSLWRAGGLEANPRRDDLIFATREHDNGWREADAAPRCDRLGRPVDFLAMPLRERIELWELGTTRWLARRPYAALLIVRHARELHRGRRAEEGWRDFLRRLAVRERRLRQELGTSGRALAADYRLLDMADRISLAACAGSTGDLELDGPACRLEADGRVQMTPLPLAGATTFRVPCRHIPLRPYRGDADLGGELAAARWEELPVRLVP